MDVAHQLDRARRWARRPESLLLLALTLVAAVVAVRSRPLTLVDDLGITARYAERIAGGDGWTYNDGDHTNGASAPLYTLVLALADLVGIDVLSAARAIGVVGFTACVSLVTHLATRASGLVGGAAAGVLLTVAVTFQTQAGGGMESVFAAALGMAVIAALAHGRTTLAGVLLGLALFTKLDAGLLAIAVGGAWWIAHRRPPWRLAATSAAVVAPWLVFSTLRFGSPLPYSASQKAGGSVDAVAHDPRWILEVLVGSSYGVPMALAVASVVLVVERLGRRGSGDVEVATALAAALAWWLLHLATFSLVDMGDRYPWYLTVLFPPIAFGAGSMLGRVARVPAPHRVVGMAVAIAVLAGSIGVFDTRNGVARTTAARVVQGPDTSFDEQLEMIRMEAGRFVGARVEAGDVVRTCFGWIAYFAPQATIEETCPLNTRDPVGPPGWEVQLAVGDDPLPTRPEGTEVVARFEAGAEPGARIEVWRHPT